MFTRELFTVVLSIKEGGELTLTFLGEGYHRTIQRLRMTHPYALSRGCAPRMKESELQLVSVREAGERQARRPRVLHLPSSGVHSVGLSLPVSETKSPLAASCFRTSLILPAIPTVRGNWGGEGGQLPPFLKAWKKQVANLMAPAHLSAHPGKRSALSVPVL